MIVVGCPVRDRAWILPSWFHAVEEAFERLGENPTYLFLYGESPDGTLDDLHRGVAGRDAWIKTIHETAERHEHKWNDERLRHMADLRNELLKMVRSVEPDYFLSLDSDILLHPEVLINLLETIESTDAVGGKCYMHPAQPTEPSYGMLTPTGNMRRTDSSGVFMVDAIMAIKLMSPAAFNVDYVHHEKGEDIGWSMACREANVHLMWDGRVCSKHVMRPGDLIRTDGRCGF